MGRWLAIVVAGLTLAGPMRGEVAVRPVGYRHADAHFEGLLASDSSSGGRRAAILFASDGPATGAFARQRITQLARLGYVVMSADIAGRDADRRRMLERAEAAHSWLARQPGVDAKRIAAVGYGIGGTAWLELARGGADLEGIALIHADAGEPLGADARKISAAILIIAGSEDPRLTRDRLQALEADLNGGGVDWQVLRFGGVGRDFTNPQSGRDAKSGAAYDADADRRATVAIQSFLAEVLAPPRGPAAKPASPPGVPDKVLRVLEHVDRNGDPPQGFEGGRTFGNFERNLPAIDGQGRRIRYREWDVNPLRPGVNRGPERLVTGSDGSAYFTDDHYRTFKKIR